jgi:glycosyltransferase involved in cell wall biosynthesis
VPPFLSLIIPAYNEEQRLPGTLQQINGFIQAQSYESEVLIVENGSHDATYAIANEFCNTHPSFQVQQTNERGKGLAVKQGMLSASGQYRMMLDADLSMPVSEINRFLPPQLNADVVIGSREAPGAVRYNEPGYRHVGGRVINGMIKLLALPGLQDTQCGFKCFSAKAAEDLFPKQTLKGWSFDIEVLYIARQRGYKIVELPIPWYYSEQSHVRPIPDTAHMFLDLLQIRRNAAKQLYA